MAVPCDHPVNDNQWHILTIKRRAKELEAQVDNCQPSTSQCFSRRFAFSLNFIVVVIVVVVVWSFIHCA